MLVRGRFEVGGKPLTRALPAETCVRDLSHDWHDRRCGFGLSRCHSPLLATGILDKAEPLATLFAVR